MNRPTNLAFQDSCKIYRQENVSAFSDDADETVFYEGKCDVQIPMTIRTFKSSETLLTDHAVYIRKMIKGVKSGDLIDITLQTGVEMNQIPISEVYARTMGTMLIIRETKN